MLHSPDLARPFQVANAHSWVVSEDSDKAIEGVTPLISDRAIFQKSFAALPVVTYQAGETVITEGSTTGRLLILGKGAVAIVKEDTEIAKVAEPGAVFGELSVLLDQPHTADVRTLEASQFHVANAPSLFAQGPIAVLYVARVLARRLDGANHTLIQQRANFRPVNRTAWSPKPSVKWKNFSPPVVPALFMRGTRSIPSHKSENFLGRRQRCAANVGGNGVEPSFCAVGAMSALPPKADFPILELLPPPALSERRHRGLARRRASNCSRETRRPTWSTAAHRPPTRV